MTRLLQAPFAWLSLAATTTWFIQVILLLSGSERGSATFRLILIVLATALVGKILSRPSRSLMLSPLMLLGLIALVFYSILPALHVQFPEILTLNSLHHRMTVEYHGGLGELLVLQFAMLCIAVASLICHLLDGAVSRVLPPSTGDEWRSVDLWAAALSVIFVAIVVAKRYSPPIADLLSTGIGREFNDALTPLISFCLATLAYMAAKGGRRRLILSLVMGTVILIGMTMAGHGRITVFILSSAFTLFLGVGTWTRKGLAVLLCAALGGVLISISALGLMRNHYQIQWHDFELADTLSSIKGQIILKLIARQSVSGICFDRAARDNHNSGNPFFFTIAIVPRVLWPAKPNLSRGSEYAEKYCGMVIQWKRSLKDGPLRPHSESLTLLGEPVINSGLIGIAVAQTFLVAVLLAATIVALKTAALGVISLTAILPWLIAFEQHFALYIANAAKMFLFITPLMAALFIMLRLACRRTE